MLTAVESYDEARHALELYVQIVDKAKEADSAAAAGLEREAELREQATRDGNFAIEGNGETSDLSRDAEENAQEALVDSDSDSLYARTLVFGARMLYKYLHDAVRADHFAQKALTLVQAETSKNLRAHDKTLLPLVQRTAGTARAALAVQGECL